MAASVDRINACNRSIKEDRSEDERIGENGEEDGKRKFQRIERDVERDEDGIRRGEM